MVPTLSMIDLSRNGKRIAAAGVLVGGIIPLILWVSTQRIIWPLVIAGAVILAAALVLSARGRRRGSGVPPRYRELLENAVPYDPQTQYPVIRASICTGERVAGFRSRVDGRFTEVMLLRSPDDERAFMEVYGVESLKTEY